MDFFKNNFLLSSRYFSKNVVRNPSGNLVRFCLVISRLYLKKFWSFHGDFFKRSSRKWNHCRSPLWDLLSPGVVQDFCWAVSERILRRYFFLNSPEMHFEIPPEVLFGIFAGNPSGVSSRILQKLPSGIFRSQIWPGIPSGIAIGRSLKFLPAGGVFLESCSSYCWNSSKISFLISFESFNWIPSMIRFGIYSEFPSGFPPFCEYSSSSFWEYSRSSFCEYSWSSF